MTIARHDEAHKLMLKGIIKGKMGSFLVIADVGKIEKLGPMRAHNKRIPDCVLPDSTSTTTLGDVQAAKLKPDIMVELDTRHGPKKS